MTNEIDVDALAAAEAGPLLEEMIEHATAAPEPGTFRVRDILHRGDGELPAPMVASALTSAGYVYLWDTQTGVRSMTNRNMLPAQLKKVREDGTRVFSTVPPKTKSGKTIVPMVGKFKCIFHPDEPNAAQYRAMGLQPCRKANLVSEFERELHARHKHKNAMKAIDHLRTEAEKAEQREFQKALVALATAGKK